MLGTIFTLFALASLAIVIWAIVSAATTPSAQFKAAGSSKVLWIVLISVFYLLTGIIGFVLAIVYLTAIAPKVKGSVGGGGYGSIGY